MDDTKWVKIESWHIIFDKVTTYCGRAYSDQNVTAEMFDPNEKSCESCLRALARDEVEDAD